MTLAAATVPLCGELPEPVRTAVEQQCLVLVVSLRLKLTAGATGRLLVAWLAMQAFA